MPGLQKILSGLLIFFLLFSVTLQIPFQQYFSYKAFAAQDEYYNLVSIIVDEDTYSAVRSKLVRYSRDIQGVLENTKVVILPTPSDASVLDIASLNESLYNEGYKSVKDNINFESRLVGTVLVGKIPVPLVFDGAQSGKSILPYVDFTEKSYIFDQLSSKYQKSDEANTELEPEIWHGVISPNTGNVGDDIDSIKDYFDKNHDFYIGKGIFNQNKGIIDGEATEANDDYEPYVFYYDQFRENNALQYQKYVGYQAYLQNIEDITYNRYSKDLAGKVKDQVLGVQNLEIADLLKNVDPSFDISGLSNGPDTTGAPDVSTRYITDNATKKFLEIFNGSTLSEMRKHVFNAGRYNEGGSKVNVDMPPFLISVIDEVTAEVIKNVNTGLEEEITNLVAGGLSRNIAIPLTKSVVGNSSTGIGASCKQEYTGYIVGTKSSDITNAAQCSVFRGSTLSGTLVEANRGININNVQSDTAMCGLAMKYDEASGKVISGMSGFWGKNTPINLEGLNNGNSGLKLGEHNLNGGIRPVFDILGSKESSDESKIPSPVDCFINPVLTQTYREDYYSYERGGSDGDTVYGCRVRFDLPVNPGDNVRYYTDFTNGSSSVGIENSPAGTTSQSRFCSATNIQDTNVETFDSIVSQGWTQSTGGNSGGGSCKIKSLVYNGKEIQSQLQAQVCTNSSEDGRECNPCPPTQVYTYKNISSYILHTSPTNEEFGKQTSALFTPSLPIDTDRYIDFIGANGGTAPSYGYKKIDFPQLFRVELDAGEDLTLENVEKKTKDYLDSISESINTVIANSNPGNLSAKEKEMYEYLKTGEYPRANVNLYTSLKNKELEVYTANNQSKSISYYDTLVFAVYWNQLKTPSSKYKFVFEEYLSSEFQDTDGQFHLPKAKPSYETAYLAAPGDAQNMYIKLDPEQKSDHPYAGIISQNLELETTLYGSSITVSDSSEDTFKCSPPDGVPIWEWIPAVICWLKDMLPPTIEIGQGSCGYDTLFLSEDERAEIFACDGDVNKNGINDCIEGKLQGGSLKNITDADRYYYGSSGVYKTQIFDAQDAQVTFDSTSTVKQELARVEVPNDPNSAFSGNNIRVIYDQSIPELAGEEDLLAAQAYISFTNVSQRASRGEVQYYFTTQSQDANVYFISRLQSDDSSGERVINLVSSRKKIEIRADQLFVRNYLVENDGTYSGETGIIASSTQNIYLFDTSKQSIDESIAASTNQNKSQKMYFGIENYSRAGNVLPLTYPISVTLKRNDEVVYEQSGISENNLSTPRSIYGAKTAGVYEIEVRDGTGFVSVRNFEVLPKAASVLDVNISTTLIETDGNISTHLVSALDSLGNLASGELYEVNMEIQGGGLVFEDNGTDKITSQIIEGYKPFRLRSTNRASNNTLSVELRNAQGKVIQTKKYQIQTISDIRLQLDRLNGVPKVGGNQYKFRATFTDKSGNTLSNLNSRVYLSIPKLYGQSDDIYTEVKNGVGVVSMTTSTLAGKQILFELQVEGGNNIYKKRSNINPDKAIQVDLALSETKIEASPDAKTIVDVSLKDRYGNTVFNNNVTEIQAEIFEGSTAIATLGSKRKTVVDGKTQFQISGTDVPGTAYFKVQSIPDLSANSFKLEGQAPFNRERLTINGFTTSTGELTSLGKRFFKDFVDGETFISLFAQKKSLEASEAYASLSQARKQQISQFWDETNFLRVSGVGSNAGSIETFYFWDKDSIDGNAFNGLYSVLLGAPYGDFTQKNYLAGALLFDRNNSSLAVSSLLNSPYKYNDIFSLEKNGFIGKLEQGSLTQDLEYGVNLDANGRLTLDIYNAALSDYVAKVYYNISNTSTIDLEINEDAAYSYKTQNGNVSLRDPSGKTIFEASKSGRFVRKSGVTLMLDTTHQGPGISLQIMHGETLAGNMKISGKFGLNITRDELLLQNKLQTLDDTLIVHLISNSYSSRKILDENNRAQWNFYYNDPFGDNKALNEFHKGDILGGEQASEEAGIGWQDTNTMLLQFSAGESVGDATENFQSFSLINLGDPVLSLKALKNSFPNNPNQIKSFDSTLGEIIDDSDGLVGYQTFDYNKDKRLDILTIKNDGYMQLFENNDTQGRFIAHENLVYSADGGSARMVQTGDFTGDGYDDIFFVNNSGKPALYNNRIKDFERYDISDSFILDGSIIQAKSFDMDADGKDDIVTLDDAGLVHIFYGGGTSRAPVFTKKFVGDGQAIRISNQILEYGGAVYFDGLTQIDEQKAAAILQDSSEYLEQLKNNPENPGSPEFINEAMVESFLYTSLPYVPTNFKAGNSQTNLVNTFGESVANVGGSSESESMAGQADELGEFLDGYQSYVSYSGFENGFNQDKYFLRGQYASTQGLQITKTYRDVNGEYLQNGDRVFYDITIKNTSNTRKNNIAFVDDLPDYFKFRDDNFTVISQDNLEVVRKSGIGEYEILIDGFTLAPGEEAVIRFELETLPIEYGYMQVGLYEKGELGDDIYGDIILKKDEKNCGKTADIFRSTAVRSYQAGTVEPTCDEDALDVGNNFPELEDADQDGIPDYMQTILESTKTLSSNPDNEAANEELVKYANQALANLTKDSDNDGISDRDDNMDSSDSQSDFMDQLDAINQSIDEISDEVDTLIDGLSCGFGGGSCIATPLNWAPLAPGNDPTLFGMPIGDGLRVGEGIPIFSALTGMNVPLGFGGCMQIPSFWPVSKNSYKGFCNGTPGAGGSLGVTSPSNFVRLFATPTLTGGFGIAACFGGPAIAAGNANPMGVHPIVPGGNCIVAAMPLFNCEGGEGDPTSLGYPIGGGDFDIIAGNCEGAITQVSTPQKLEDSFVRDYLEYLRTGRAPSGLYGKYEQAMTDLGKNGGGNYYLPSQPFINIGNSNSTALMSTSVDIDTSALAAGNLGDVVQINNKRVGAFPNFLMDWVERQLDEVTSKLTNLPKVFVVLPEMSGLINLSWNNFAKTSSDFNQEKTEDNTQERLEYTQNIDGLRAQKTTLDCSGRDAVRCRAIDLQIISAQGKSTIGNTNQTLSGIQEVYEFLGNIPLLDIETETVDVSIPWIDQTEINKSLVDWKLAAEQWQREIEKAEQRWSLGAACNGATTAEQERCQQENSIKNKASVDAKALLYTLQTNIQILEEYKELPERLSKLIQVKEHWLEQILCNVEIIATLMGEWISTNGERFKAWVELYVLIKAILKSWQLLIDVFIGYEEECHECKNERQDLQSFIFRLVSAIIPSPPIIEFPKWPDIILDLSNIRAGLTVYLPDFNISPRPIVLPLAPRLVLPDTPSASLTLPELPLLPRYTLPELPDLPTLPSVELPDLPPPPKIPKLFGAVEGVLNIMKLVTKVMCILKTSPFVPEWRAGDQIAFLTERNGYLPTDFIDIQPPAFSYSAISAIKVSTYVNFEFESEFIIEAVSNIMEPLDSKTSNIANMFDLKISNLDFSDAGIEDVNIQIENDGSISSDDVSFAPLNENPNGIYVVAALLAKKGQDMISFMQENADETLDNTEFTKYVGTQLASVDVTQDQSTQELRNLWDEVRNLQYSKEDAFIAGLQDNSSEKFKALIDILSTEIQYSQDQIKKVEILSAPSFIKEVESDFDNSSRFEMYTSSLEEYNLNTLDAAITLASGESEATKKQRLEIEAQAENIQKRVSGGLNSYKEGSELAAVSPTGNTSTSSSGGTCNPSGTYQYTYDGIYVLEYGKNYKLFDYTDILKGDEEPSIVDIDGDRDEDVLYLADGKLYFKENRKNTPTVNFVSGPPLILAASDNDFFSGEYIESINYFEEAQVSDEAINISFQKPTNPLISQFRLTYNTLVDRYMDESDTYVSSNLETHIVDAYDSGNKILQSSAGSNYKIQKNRSYLKYTGNMSGLKLTTQKLQNIGEVLEGGGQVIMTSKTPLYSANDSFRIRYTFSDGEEGSTRVDAHSSIVFDRSATITGINGNAYIDSGIQEDIFGTNITSYIGKPLFNDSHIVFEGNTSTLSASSHVDVGYHDGSVVQLDMREVESYTVYDLGNNNSDNYNIRLSVPNDFYYARIQAFNEDLIGTQSNQILLSPQTFSDTLPPQIGLNQKIRIPVYQTQTVDLTPYIYEDGGLSGISSVRLDMDLEVDSDNDGNSENDRNTQNIQITRNASRIAITFGPYDVLVNKNIRISITDDNGNTGTKVVPFEVYAPVPEINDVVDNTIVGQIDETLSDEPIRLYRYRGGTIEKLQEATQGDLVPTNIDGGYDFESLQTSSGVVMYYNDSPLAEINEYTGKIDLKSALASIQILPSNDSKNTSVYPEIVIYYANTPVYRQFMKIPAEEINIVSKLSQASTGGSYLHILNQTDYSSFRVPLGVPYNPGSISIYRTGDTTRTPIMTVFQDGRITLASEFRLGYKSNGDNVSYVLIQKQGNQEVAELLYDIQSSYIVR
ncbi:VCBS repeat-containing protein [Candidatus Gracilibacteria bacterium]|nr:VCBS repeat-containing protein [Candidatus Gracilibacteria bacterium]